MFIVSISLIIFYMSEFFYEYLALQNTCVICIFHIFYIFRDNYLCLVGHAEKYVNKNGSRSIICIMLCCLFCFVSSISQIFGDLQVKLRWNFYKDYTFSIFFLSPCSYKSHILPKVSVGGAKLPLNIYHEEKHELI